jgi:hypothetical protein
MGLGSEIRDPEKTYSGSRIQGSKRHLIRIRNTGRQLMCPNLRSLFSTEKNPTKFPLYFLFPLILTRCEGPWPEPQPGQHPGLCELRHQLGVHPLRGRSVHGGDILHHHQGDSAQRGDPCLLWR